MSPYLQAAGGDAEDKLKDLLGQEGGGEEGDEQLMKLMEGMMGMLVSKDVLYPSLMELCNRVSTNKNYLQTVGSGEHR